MLAQRPDREIVINNHKLNFNDRQTFEEIGAHPEPYGLDGGTVGGRQKAGREEAKLVKLESNLSTESS